MLGVFLSFAVFGAAQSRVTFTNSEFIDGSDLRLATQTDFGCSKGCMVYSATENPNLVIINKATGIEVANLNLLANSNANDRSYLYGVTLPPATYTLKNKSGLTGAVFGLYVVANNAPDYGQSLRVADAFATSTFSTTTGLMTIMTRGTGVRMVSMNSASSMTPRVFAAGYDAPKVDECWPVYQANSLSHAQQSQVDVIGPIATIRFDGLPLGTTASVKVSGDVLSDPSDLRNSLTISSPGFNGCRQPYDHRDLYQVNLDKIDRRFRSDLNGGVMIHVRSKQWIPDNNDALNIYGLQDQPVKLMGEQSYEHDYLVNKVDVQLVWQRSNPNSNFAVQMDATKSAAATSLLLAIVCALFMLF